ncbi:hypothetical protein [Brevibacillus nitrificans]|uniref:hypothetical protein n=1 Tax=Brevibacillus nitrificans TaxID=651560 RepID=UPI00285A8C4E|nr:hypothetical protein [Brevibacillus nitrificans]MDR7316329.1 hypothetical protein [Brevibacillus nitrificans]
MRQAAAFFVLLFALVSTGCSEGAAAPTEEMKLPIEMDAKQKDPEPAAGKQPGATREEMSKEWVVNRLVDISRHYFSKQEEALSQNLPFEEFREDLQRYMTDRFIDQEGLEQYYDGGIGMTRLFKQRV